MQEFYRARRGFLNGWMVTMSCAESGNISIFCIIRVWAAEIHRDSGCLKGCQKNKVDCLLVLSQTESIVPGMGSESISTPDSGDVVIDFDKINQLMEELDTKEGKKFLSGRSL